MKKQGAAFRALLITILAGFAFSLISYGPVFRYLGTMLVEIGSITEADAAFVPFQQNFLNEEGRAVVYAAGLAHHGYARTVLIDSGIPYYNKDACDVWIPVAHQNAATALIECIAANAGAEWRRMAAAAKLIEARGFKRVLVITSAFNSKRHLKALRTFNVRCEFRAVSYEQNVDYPSSWWRTREGRKYWLFSVISYFNPKLVN